MIFRRKSQQIRSLEIELDLQRQQMEFGEQNRTKTVNDLLSQQSPTTLKDQNVVIEESSNQNQQTRGRFESTWFELDQRIQTPGKIESRLKKCENVLNVLFSCTLIIIFMV